MRSDRRPRRQGRRTAAGPPATATVTGAGPEQGGRHLRRPAGRAAASPKPLRGRPPGRWRPWSPGPAQTGAPAAASGGGGGGGRWASGTETCRSPNARKAHSGTNARPCLRGCAGVGIPCAGRTIRGQIDKTRSLKDPIPANLRHATLVQLASACKGAPDRQALCAMAGRHVARRRLPVRAGRPLDAGRFDRHVGRACP